MSQPKRYDIGVVEKARPDGTGTINVCGAVESFYGSYVLHSDYAALVAENERLRADILGRDATIAGLDSTLKCREADASEASSLQSFLKWNGMEGAYKEWLDWRAERPVTLTNSKTWQMLGEYAEAKEQIARLEKAGDTVVAAYCMGDWDTERWKEYPVVAQWLAAKEGRDAK